MATWFPSAARNAAVGMMLSCPFAGAPLPVVDWANGEQKRAGAVLRIQTRPSILYARLFAALGDFAKGVEVILLVMAVGLGVILLPAALFIGTRLTRTVTGAVAQLYEATKHINRGDFSHRIPVKSHDQLATLANSFNSMTASIEKLIEEQKQKLAAGEYSSCPICGKPCLPEECVTVQGRSMHKKCYRASRISTQC